MLCCLRDLSNHPEAQLAKREREKEREYQRINKQIEKDLKKAKKIRNVQRRILLLGCGEAGKSTFIKQMRIIHSKGFEDDEKKLIKDDIAVNIVSAIQTLVDNLDPEVMLDPHLEDMIKLIERLPTYPRKPTPQQVYGLAKGIKELWLCPAIQEVYSHRNRLQLVESAKYFLDRVEEVMSPEYIPDNQDIVMTRVRTVGIVEHDFEIVANGQKQVIVLIDVGGQRNERRKWIHCFEDVMLLIFLTAISEYDQVLMEDEMTNRIEESLYLFETILKYQWFAHTNVILFLNKVDLLESKLEYSHIDEHFPDFPGPRNDLKAAIEYFRSKFMSCNQNKEREIFVHETCATDTKNIEIVDAVLRETILNNILKEVLIN